MKTFLLFILLFISSQLTRDDFIQCVNLFRFINGKEDVFIDTTLNSSNSSVYITNDWEELPIYLEKDTMNVVQKDSLFFIYFK